MTEENFNVMAKKNFGRASRTNNINSAMGFTYPKRHNGKTIYVDFYVFDPASGEKKRIKKHFDNIKNKREREAAISHYMAVISQKLRQGWNPLAECGNKGLTTIELVFEKYENSLLQYSRKKTIQNYTSRLNILKEYISELTLPPKYIYQLNKAFFIEFLDWLVSDRDVTGRTRNNYKGWLSSFCTWMIDRNYISENYAESIPKVKESEKIRQALTAPELKTVFEYLLNTDKRFLLAVLFQYYTLIRPTELSHLKLSDMNIKDGCIYVSGNFSKNRRDGTVSLNPVLVKLMLELGVFRYPDNYYLFGKNLRPAEERIGPDQFNKRWAKVRKILKLRNEIQFYSFKDSGIRDLANDKGIVTARDQARHTDISTTNKYLSGRDKKGPAEAKSFSGAFSFPIKEKDPSPDES